MDPKKELKLYKTALRRQIQKTRLLGALLKQERGERLSPSERLYIAKEPVQHQYPASSWIVQWGV